MSDSCLAVTAKRVLIGSRLEPGNDLVIIIEKGRIKEITDKKIFSETCASRIPLLDLGDRTLLPGMIECHNHVSLDARRKNYLQRMNLSACELTLDGLQNLKDDLMSGVTTARSCGDRFYIDVVLRDKIRDGEVIGPDLIASGIGMRSLHGHGYVGLPHTGVQEFRIRSRENLAHGADMLKIYITGGAPPKKGGMIPCYLSDAEVRTVAEEAENLGLPTAAHCIGGPGVRRCVENGVAVIEHAYCISDEDLDLVIRRDCWIDLTSGVFLDPAREPFYDSAFLESVRGNREKIAATMEKTIQSGVKYTIGTDAFHGNLYRELELAVALGATPRDALMAVGSRAAVMCGREDTIGSLSVGLDADLIAAEGDPLKDIRCMKDISFVMKKGNVYKNTAI